MARSELHLREFGKMTKISFEIFPEISGHCAVAFKTALAISVSLKSGINDKRFSIGDAIHWYIPE